MWVYGWLFLLPLLLWVLEWLDFPASNLRLRHKVVWVGRLRWKLHIAHEYKLVGWWSRVKGGMTPKQLACMLRNHVTIYNKCVSSHRQCDMVWNGIRYPKNSFLDFI